MHCGRVIHKVFKIHYTYTYNDANTFILKNPLFHYLIHYNYIQNWLIRCIKSILMIILRISYRFSLTVHFWLTSLHITNISTFLFPCYFSELVRKLEACLKLNEAYEEQYKLTKAKLEQNPKGKQFTFDEMQIFGKFKLFCRRVIKLIDMFSTIDQFNSLSKNKLEGI